MTEFTLTDRQQKTVAFAITLFCAVVILTFVGGLFWLLGAAVVRFGSILLPLGVAMVFALVLKPSYDWVCRRVGGRRVLAVFILYLSVLLPFAVLTILFGAKIVEESVDFARNVPGWANHVQQKLQAWAPTLQSLWIEYEVTAKMQSILQQHGASIFKSATQVGVFTVEAWSNVFQYLASLLSWFVFPIYLAFFLMGRALDKEQVEGLLPFLKEETRRDVSYLVFEFIDILVSFFRGQLVIAIIQGLLMAIGFSIIGVEYGFSLGLILGLLNIIPYLGSVVGLSIVLPLALFQPGGGVLTFLLAIVVFTVVQLIEGYFLTPKIMGERTGLHPVAIIFAIFFWGSVFGGITGMILAIPLTAFLVVFWRLAKARYIQEVL